MRSPVTRHLIPRAALGAALGVALLAGALPGQVTTVDEGSFTISRNGQTVGREEFTIRSTPGAGGAHFVARGTVSYTDRRLAPALSADSAGAPLQYQVEVKSGTETEEMLSGKVGRGRFSARIQTPKGESAREYIVADGALIIDDDVFHQYFFLARADRAGTVPVVVPRRNVQLSMQVSQQGDEQLSIGGRVLPGRRLLLTEPGGATRDVWVDARGRVLKVSIPARGVVAVRDDPPK